MQNVLAISPLDGRYFNKVAKIADVVSEFGLNKYRIYVEVEWLKLLFSIPEIGLPTLNESEIELLNNIVKKFDANECDKVKQIENTTNHDVKAIEYYIKEQLKVNDKLHTHREFVHFACTSEDINNLSYALMLKDIKEKILLPELNQVKQLIKEYAINYRDISMMSRTHGQPATPTTMGKELYNVYYRLERQLGQLAKQEILGKINGAVGNYNAHMVSYPNIDWPKLSQTFIEDKLDLTFNPFTTQIEPHDYVAEICDNLKRINTILIDFSRDIWGYISINYFKQKVVAGETGSSTMPHKVNPIDFENCEGNLGLANSLAVHLAEKLPISRWQRDLTDSTVQRNIGVLVGYCMLAYSSLTKGLGKLEINQGIINAELNNNWELLAEPIQTTMRKLGIHDAYEQLKDLTRGKKVDAIKLAEFINNLNIPQIEKTKLLKLTPENYIGYASKLF